MSNDAQQGLDGRGPAESARGLERSERGLERSERDMETTLAATGAGDIGRSGALDIEALADLPRGTVLGRYVVLRKIGAGGMGIVFAAYDPELDRKVAIKLLVIGGEGSTSASTGKSRLLREAQALAKLSHPNVVSIYDVGTWQGRVWLAMEFVEGLTLGKWLKAAPRTWREIRTVFLAAGKGLAAAHKKGLLHRDFKPDNVMVGHEGRVRVMDFGLARANEDGGGPASLMYESAVREATAIHNPDSANFDAAALFATQQTNAGALLGTPAYLAPEVFRGDTWGAGADQFAFCITLWEALYNERPFAGDSLVELATHVLEGTMRPAPRGTAVPGWLRRVCLRGLHVNPARRWADMSELLQAMQADPGQTRRRLGLAAGLVAAVGGGLAYQQIRAQRSHDRCLALAEGTNEVWSPQRREWLRDKLLAIESTYADQTAPRVEAALDAYVSDWSRHRAATCSESDPNRRASPELREMQSQCFDTRLDAFDTLVGLLGEATADQLRYAVVAAIELPGTRRCVDDPADLADSTKAGALPKEEFIALRRELLAARVLLKAGQLEGAQTHAQQALARANKNELPESAAEAQFLAGAIAYRAGDFAKAEADLRSGYFAAFELGREQVAANAAVVLTRLHAVGRVNLELSQLWLESARSLAARVGDEDPVLNAELATAAAALATERGDYSEAELRFREAIEIREATFGDTHPDIGLMYGDLAELYDDIGKFAAAEKAAQRGLKLLDRSLGSTHPDNSQALFALATAAWKTGRGAESLELSERALELRLAAFGPEHVSVAEALNSVGNARIQLGDWEGSDQAHSQALEIRRRVYGPDEPRVATSLVNLADVAVHAGRHDEGIEYARGALRIWEDKLGKDHAYCAYAHIVVGEGELREGRYRKAKAAFERALEIRSASEEAEQQLAEPLTGLGLALLELGELSQALVHLEQAHQIRKRHPSDEMHSPDTAFVLARALWVDPNSRARAMKLATEAKAQFAVVAASRPEGVAAIDAWLADPRRTQAPAN